MSPEIGRIENYFFFKIKKNNKGIVNYYWKYFGNPKIPKFLNEFKSSQAFFRGKI